VLTWRTFHTWLISLLWCAFHIIRWVHVPCAHTCERFFVLLCGGFVCFENWLSWCINSCGKIQTWFLPIHYHIMPMLSRGEKEGVSWIWFFVSLWHNECVAHFILLLTVIKFLVGLTVAVWNACELTVLLWIGLRQCLQPWELDSHVLFHQLLPLIGS